MAKSEEESKNEKGKTQMNEYEMQRLKRIEENKKRMEALGLQKMATSYMGSVEKVQKKMSEKKGKKKMTNEDEEYNPIEEDDDGVSSSSDEEFSGSEKKKVKRNNSNPQKMGPAKKLKFDSDFVDDDDALIQAIALSLGFSDVKTTSPSKSSGPHVEKKQPTHNIDTSCEKSKENHRISDDSGKRKRKKPVRIDHGQQIASRVQMSEDELLIHFFEFDETGRGSFTVRDIERIAIAHDFIWSEKELADMIYCFDSDGDKKISFDDFRKIVVRCNMLKVSDNDTTGQ